MTAKKSQDGTKRLTFEVSTAARPDFKGNLLAFAFNNRGDLLDSAEAKAGKVALSVPEADIGRARVFLIPAEDSFRDEEPTLTLMERLGAYEPVLHAGPDAGPIKIIDIPGIIIDRWPLCSCWVRGQILRSSDNRAVCDARVHICEVDRIPWLIRKLPELDLLRLRDDLLEVLRDPPIPQPPGPRPDPVPFERPLYRFAPGGDRFDPGSAVGFNPQPEPPARFDPGSAVGFNPQPEPPALRLEELGSQSPARVRAASRAIALDAEIYARLHSDSISIIRETLVANWKLILPWLCIWPRWWWRFRCDELAVVTTDAHGRFETIISYPCWGDRPDLFFWVEYDFGGGFETVHRPPIACNTHWNYDCGTEVTIHVSDPRLPGCDGEPDLPGCQVVVLSICNGVAVREIQTDAAGSAHEGLTTAGQPFGATLEPRVDFSRTALIDGKNIPYYRWSYQRLSGPDGVGTMVDLSTVPVGGPHKPLTRAVYRHYKLGTSYPSDPMGPMPTSGPAPIAPIPDLFRIRPASPPAGVEWIILNEHIDLATAYFETGSLPGTPASPPPFPAADDLAAGRYELILELFDATGAKVNWTVEGIDLRITDQDAPFGTGTVTTSPVTAYNRILNSTGDTMGFRMVVRVDNNHCFAEIQPLAGDVPPDPLCGFHEYGSLADQALLSFVARHANGFATYGFNTRKATGPPIGIASTSGTSGAAGTGGFLQVGGFTYEKLVSVGALLGSCANAAFAERLAVHATATNGYSRLSGYDHADTAAFALAQPCPPCDCEEENS